MKQWWRRFMGYEMRDRLYAEMGERLRATGEETRRRQHMRNLLKEARVFATVGRVKEANDILDEYLLLKGADRDSLALAEEVRKILHRGEADKKRKK